MKKAIVESYFEPNINTHFAVFLNPAALTRPPLLASLLADSNQEDKNFPIPPYPRTPSKAIQQEGLYQGQTLHRRQISLHETGPVALHGQGVARRGRRSL